MKLIRIMGSANSMDSQLRGQLSFLNKTFEVIAVASGKSLLNKIRERENIHVYNINMAREINLFSDFISLVKMMCFFFREKPDIVHGSSPKGALLSMLASYICRVPNRIYTVTGLRFETTKGLFRKFLIFVERINCFCATKIIPEGEGVKKTLIENKITQKPLNVILNGNINGIDTSYFSPNSVSSSKETIRNQLSISNESFVFIFVGRLVKDKGINELIHSFLKIQKDFDCSLIVLGDLEQVNMISLESKNEILTNSNIKYIGYVDDIRPYLKASDAFVFPSYREGFPNVLLQASSMCLPSIVTNISGSNEIIIDKRSGLIISKENAHELYEAMRLFITQYSKVELRNMGIYARSVVLDKFEQAKVWEALLSEYNNLLFK